MPACSRILSGVSCPCLVLLAREKTYAAISRCHALPAQFFEKHPKLFSTAFAPFYIPLSNSQDSKFSTFLPYFAQCLLVLFIMALVGLKWDLMILTCISLKMTQVELHSICLTITYGLWGSINPSPSTKFAITFLLSCKSSLYLINSIPLSDT